jgi:hypothetical protein
VEPDRQEPVVGSVEPDLRSRLTEPPICQGGLKPVSRQPDTQRVERTGTDRGGFEMTVLQQAASRSTDLSLVNARTIDTVPDEDEGPTYAVTGYTVYPTGFDRISVPERDQWRIQVVDSGDGWAVRWRNRCLNYRRAWEFEPPPRGRSQEFLNQCRFSERSALNRARQVIDELVVDGMTFEEFVEHVREEAVAEARAFLDSGHRESLADADLRTTALMRNRFRRAFRQNQRAADRTGPGRPSAG